jgi:hypothetical protein
MEERMSYPEEQQKEMQGKAELKILSEYGFSFDWAHLLELKEHCIADNTKYFIDNSLIREMKLWQEKNQEASEEDIKKSIIVLIETTSNDYIYGRLNKQDMPDKKEGERKLFEGKITPEEHFRTYIATQEPMANQLEEIIERVLGKKEVVVNNATEETNGKVKKVIEREAPIYA